MMMADTYKVTALPGMGLGLTKGKTYARKVLLAKCMGNKNKEKELIKKLTDTSIFVRAAIEKAKAKPKPKPEAKSAASPKAKALPVVTDKSKVLKEPKVLKKPSAVMVVKPAVTPAVTPAAKPAVKPAKPAPVRMTPAYMTVHVPPKEGNVERYMVLSLPHLGLALKTMRVYTKTDLEAKCKGDKALLEKLRAKLKDPALFKILP